MTNPAYPEQEVGEQLRVAPVRPLDLTGRERHLRSAISTMDKIGQGFARYARRSMPFLVRQRARIVAGTTQVVGMSDVEPLEEPTFTVHVGPNETLPWGSVVLNAYAVAMTIEGALGGASNNQPIVPEGEFTPAQRALLIRVARSLAVDFCTVVQEEAGLAWKPLAPDTPPPTALTRGDVLQVGCTIDGLSIPARIALAASAEALEAAARERGIEGEAIQTDPRLLESMQQVPVEVVAELGRIQLGLRRILSLRVGDVLRLKTAVDDPVPLYVGGIEKFQAMPVLSRGQLAIEVRTRKNR
jgi:flagellar motor switch protein FliM